jgi:hypothetical protein
MPVNETVIAMIRPKPDRHLPAGEPAEAIAGRPGLRRRA